MILKYKVINNNFYNVKDVLINYFQMSDRLIAKLKRQNKIFLNNKNVYVTELLNINDLLKIDLNFEEESDNIIPVKATLDIIYEDEGILAINKPAFLPVHPSCNYYKNSLANIVKYYFEKKRIKAKIRPVNRLDKDTSGIVIFAKNQYIQECLIKQMKTNKMTKEYITIAEGIIDKNQFTINAPIARKNKSIIEREVNENGDIAITDFEVISKKNNLSILKCKLKTGRTHQIRVHLSYIGHPIIR